jgi:hypothetical protein
MKAFTGCAREGISVGTITSESGLEACIAAGRSAASAKIAGLVAKLGDTYDSSCAGVEFLSFLCSDGGALESCLDRFADCGACAVVRGVDGVATDCDAFDDGAANGSCPDACGNGIVGIGWFAAAEGCDDGNFADADGCDSNCTPTACGNGITAGAEHCDGFSGRCIGGAYDGLLCYSNAECSGGVCTSCPSGDCGNDCTACGPGACCRTLGCGGPEPGFGSFCFGDIVPCNDADCQFAGTCCEGTFAEGHCLQSFPDNAVCEDLGGENIPCGECAHCCEFDGYCTPWAAETCLEYEGTPVDCSQCWP